MVDKITKIKRIVEAETDVGLACSKLKFLEKQYRNFLRVLAAELYRSN